MDLDAIFDQAHGNSTATVEQPTQNIIIDSGPGVVATPAATPSTGIDLDALFNAVHENQPVAQQQPQTIWDKFTSRPTGEKIGVTQSIAGPLLSMGDWVGLDEGTAAVNALIDKAQGGDFTDSYDKYLTGARGAIDSFRKASPTAAIGLDVAGGVKFIPSAISKAPTLFTKAVQAAKEGALFGGLYGFGSGRDGFDKRLQEGEKGAALGAVTGLVATPIVETAGKGVKVAADWLAEKGISASSFVDDLRNKFASQRGAIGENVADPIQGLSNTEIEFARQLKQQSPEELLAAAQKLDDAASQKSPLFVPEALDSADVYNNAKYIAKNNKASMKMSQDAINARKDTAGERIGTLMNDIAPQQDPATVGMGLINASNEAVDKLAAVRKDATAPLYKALESKSVPDDIAINLLDDPVIEAAASTINKNPAFRKQIGDAPVESFKSLQLIKENLDDQVATLTRAGSNNEARIVAGSRDKLIDALDQLDEYRTVTDRYKELSKPINKLTGTKQETGLLEGILNTEKMKAHQAPAELLKLTPAQIEAAKQSLGKNGELELRRSARSLLTDVLEQANENSQPALKLLNNEQITAKFKAMMGDEAFNKFSANLDREKLMAKANNKYLVGSDTAQNLVEKADSEDAVGLLAQLSKKDWKGLVERLMGQPVSDDVAKGLSEIYFNTEKGLEALKKVTPLVNQYGKNSRVVNQLAGAADVAASRGAEPALKKQQPKPKKGLLSVGGLGAGATLTQQDFPLPSDVKNMIKATPTPEAKMEETPIVQEMVQEAPKTEKTAEKPKIDPTLIKAVTWQESRGKSDAVSPKGATGLMQVMPATAKEIAAELGYKDGEYDLKDPDTSMEFGTHYLGKMMKQFKDEGLALAAYNAGPGKVDQWVKKYGNSWDKVLSGIKKDILDGKLSRKYYKETLDYVPSILKKRDQLVEV